MLWHPAVEPWSSVSPAVGQLLTPQHLRGVACCLTSPQAQRQMDVVCDNDEDSIAGIEEANGATAGSLRAM